MTNVLITKLGFSKRALKALHSLGVRYLIDATEVSKTDLLCQHNCGRVTVREVAEVMAQHGLVLAEGPTRASIERKRRYEEQVEAWSKEMLARFQRGAR